MPAQQSNEYMLMLLAQQSNEYIIMLLNLLQKERHSFCSLQVGMLIVALLLGLLLRGRTIIRFIAISNSKNTTLIRLDISSISFRRLPPTGLDRTFLDLFSHPMMLCVLCKDCYELIQTDSTLLHHDAVSSITSVVIISVKGEKT